jgi:N-acyl-D-amino-acid deacylase
MKWLRQTRNLFWGAVFAALWRRAREGASVDPSAYNLLLRGGLVYDGSGAPPFVADVGIVQDRIVAIGDLAPLRGRQEIDATGFAVAPGFINMLSWATESLIADPSSESDLRQGVTLEVFGEGVSMGPLNAAMRDDLRLRQGDRRFDVDWTSLGEYLEFLEKRGVSTNVASFVGATSLRIHELGHAARAPTARELARMAELVRQAMREGALGVGSALIYAPAVFAAPAELEALALAAAEYGGGYISHLRSESGRLLEALDELIAIARLTGQHAEVYHLKAAGASSWPLMAQAIARIEAARAEGLDVSANMYPYVAGASGLDASMPPWVQADGHGAWLARLRDPALRQRILAEIAAPSPQWESLYAAAGSADNVRLLGFHSPALRHCTGLTLGELARRRGQPPEQVMIDLVLEDRSRVNVAYFMMDEANVRRQLALPWVSLCSDEESLAPRGAFLRQTPHPRAYGAFARFLGHYVRDERLVDLADAIRRLTSLPARNLRLKDRGELRPGAFADLALFDPARIADRATWAQPHQFAAGVEHVIVNGQPVLRDGRLTGARPGRVVRGPGWKGAVPSGRGAAAPGLPRAAG